MSTLRLRHRLTSRARILGATAVLTGALLGAGACGSYQLALQGTATPATGGALGVRQLPPGSPQPVVGDPAALAAAVQAAPASAIANQLAVPAASPAPAAAASPALASAAPARPAIGDLPGGSAAAAAPAPSATATATPAARPASTAAAPRAATPMPAYTAAPPRATSAAPRANATPAPSPSPSPSPSPTQARPTTVQVWLPEGVSDFMYAGRTLPVDQALAALAGSYDVIYFKPAGAAETIAYRPGIDSVPVLPNNTLVRIGMKKAMSFVMQLPQ